MTTNKRILFEGQDVNLSNTMQQLQRTAERMYSNITEKSNIHAKSSAAIVSSMKEEISSAERLARISYNDKRLENAEKYKRKLEEIQLKEDKYIRGARNLQGSALDDYEREGKARFDSERAVAKGVRDEANEEASGQLREQRTTNELLKEILNQEKRAWETEVAENKSEVKSNIRSARRQGLDTLDPEERAKISYQENLIKEQDRERSKEGSFFNDLIKVGLLRDAGQAVSQIPQAKDAYDLIPTLSAMAGGMIGGLAGAGADAISGASVFGFSLGEMNLGIIGSELGRQAGSFAGQSALRHVTEKEALDKSMLAYRAAIGSEYGGGSVSQFGVSRAEAASIAAELQRGAGLGDTSVSDLLGLEKGFGLDRSLLMDRGRNTRFTGGSLSREMRNLLGSMGDQGYERVFFNEIISTQNELIKAFSAANEKIDPNNVTATMLELSSLGGAFSLRDPRSSGMYQGIHEGLSKTNDFGKAMNLQILRQMNPGGSLLDLLEMEEQGLGGERGREFLKGTLSMHKQMFGNDEDLLVLSLKSRFPNIPYQQLRRLAKGEDVIGTMSGESSSPVDMSGQGNISTRARMEAEISDSWAEGVISGMTKTKDQMAEIIALAMGDAMKMIQENLISVGNSPKTGSKQDLGKILMGTKGNAN